MEGLFLLGIMAWLFLFNGSGVENSSRADEYERKMDLLALRRQKAGKSWWG